jgi:hypothetical protein
MNQSSQSEVWYLKDRNEGLPERVEVAAWFLLILIVVKLAAKDLHAEQREDDDEEKEEQQKTDDGTHTVEQRRD